MKLIAIILLGLLILSIPLFMRWSATAQSATPTLVWSSRTPMPAERFAFGVAEVNGQIYAIGGRNPNLLLQGRMDKYDPATDSWETMASVPHPTDQGTAATALNNKIYVAEGGSNYLDIYDPASNTWSQGADIPVLRGWTTLTTGSNGKIYLIGGFDYSGFTKPPMGTVEEYDPQSNAWTEKTSMPTLRGSAATVEYSGKIYVIGGDQGDVSGNTPTYLSTVEAYDPITDSWTSLANLQIPRSHLAAAVLDNKIYAISGLSTKSTPASVEEYNPASNTWSYSSNLPQARYLLGALSFNNIIYTLGGIESLATNRVDAGFFDNLPVLNTINNLNSPILINTTINPSLTFTDSDVNETHTAIWNWGDETNSLGAVTETNGSGNVTGNHTFTKPGLYDVSVSILDSRNGSASSSFPLAIIDPNVGFLTGSGEFSFPSKGKVKIDLEAKYLPGSKIPVGKSSLRFKEGNQEFTSTSYQWLVVSGSKAFLKGDGTINGSGNYTFLISALDSNKGEKDLIRVKITDSSNKVIYDTQPGASDADDPTTPFTEGSIKLH